MLFSGEAAVLALLASCRFERGKQFFLLSSASTRDKAVCVQYSFVYSLVLYDAAPRTYIQSLLSEATSALIHSYRSFPLFARRQRSFRVSSLQ